ncbi:hypothetical protein DWV56_05450 [Holdemanella biformis]|uniref:Uncharacterized protein n=1 Tax=Holdemanella biformis TaxID=1735 RepID=A0A413CUC2_9FIRM|nr:hypothetical protein DWV56_05450 [Holdemanella biformis]
MKKGRFLWSAYRITERWKAGKARNIKGKQLKNSRNTVLKQLVVLHNSLNVSILLLKRKQKPLYKGFFLLSKYYEIVCVGHK